MPALLPSGGISWWSHQLLTAATLIYANGTGISMAADTRHTLEDLAGGVTNYISSLGKSACPPSWLGGSDF